MAASAHSVTAPARVSSRFASDDAVQGIASALSKIFDGNLGWISDNRPEIPPGTASTFAATAALNQIEVADMMDRLLVLTTGATSFRHYITRYPTAAGDPFDHVWGVDDKQQDQSSSGGSAYVISGTVAVSNTAVTGTNTFFTTAMVGYRIGFGTTNPNSVSTWYTISAFTSITSITLSSSAGTIGSGSAYVIDWNSYTVPHLNTASQVMTLWSENGIAHIVKHGATTALSQLYALPLSAHWTYASSTNQRAITPALYTANCSKFTSVAVMHDDRIGTGEFSMNTEPYRLYYRLTGIDDNSGEWSLVPRDGDLSSLAAALRIQFMFEFSTIGAYCIPARIMSLTVVYDDTAVYTDSHFQPSVGALGLTIGKRFVWRFATAFGGTVPTLRVRIYNAITNDLLLDDYTVGSTGSWNKSTNGVNLIAYNTSDKANETTYIIYANDLVSDNMKVRAVLTQ